MKQVANALDKLNHWRACAVLVLCATTTIALPLEQANAIVQSPATQKLIDNANSGNINCLQQVGDKVIRITTDRTGQRVISVGYVRANIIVNGLANGRFTSK